MVVVKEERFGLTLIETLVSIAVAIVLVLSLNALFISKILEDRGKRMTLAAALAQEEMEKLINRDVANLTNTTSAEFIDVLYHEGTHAVASSALAYSSPNLVTVTSDAALNSRITGSLVTPKNLYNDVTVDARLMLNAGSPAGAGKGIVFRAQDKKNGYLVTVTDTDVRLVKLINGVETTLYSSAFFVVYDSWDRFELTVSGTTIDVRLNGISLATVNDSTYADGYLAFVATNGGTISIDSTVITDGMGSTTYTFDTLPIGALGGEWQRQSVGDLPQGRGEVDIADYLGDTSIKDVSVRVLWNEQGAPKTYELNTLVTE